MARIAGEAVHPAAQRVEAAPLVVSPEKARLWLILGVYVLVALMSCLYVSQTSVVASAGYQVGTLESARDQMKLRNDQLGLQLAEARSIATVQREAKRLGMAPPERSVYLKETAPDLPVVGPGRPSPVEPSWIEEALAWFRELW